MQEATKLELRAKPKQSIHVNKSTVLVISAVVVFVVLLAVINAFNTTQTTKSDASAIKVKTDKPVAVSNEVNELPSSYSDVSAIQRYSFAGQHLGEVSKLQQQLNDLKQAYESLQWKLSNIDQSGSERVTTDPRTAQAKTSGLTFSGLGGSMQSVVGAGAGSAPGSVPGSMPGGGSPYSPYGSRFGANKQDDVVATAQQAKFYEQQADNKQKIAVMSATDRPDDSYDLHPENKPVSKYQVMAGTIVPASLITGINTTLSGAIVAQVRQNIYDTITGKYLLVPRGSKLIGNYDSRIMYGQRRVAIIFTRIIRPDGTSILIGRYNDPNGTDLQGHSGIEGDVNNHWGKILGAATISTLLSVGSGVAADQMSNSNKEYRNSKQDAVLGGAKGISDVGQNISNRALNIQPTITLPAGYQFNVVVKKDMVFRTPYRVVKQDPLPKKLPLKRKLNDKNNIIGPPPKKRRIS